jgi:hypothetical protein
MRSILGIMLLLLGMGLVSCRFENPSAEFDNRRSQSDWVRTVDGWQKSNNWIPSLAAPPAVHPLTIAAAQVLVSLFALAASTDPGDRK